MKHLMLRRQGQSLVIVAIFALTLFLFMGVGIDSSMLYLERRHLQNTVDAACLAAATRIAAPNLPGDPDSALTPRDVALKYINNNIGSGALAMDPATVQPIILQAEEGNRDVRIQLTAQASSFFMRVAGVNTYTVTARAHCDTTKGGGIWPVAVNRFPGYDNQGDADPNNDSRVGVANTGATLPQTFGHGPTLQYTTVRDTLQASSANSGILNDQPPPAVVSSSCNNNRNWYNWPDLGSPAPPYGTGPTGVFAQPCQAAAPDDPGYEVEMAGLNADPNVSGGGGYTGPLLLDYRQVSHTPHLFYNGMNDATATNSWKGTIVDNIMQGYKGPDVLPAQELAIVDGISAGQIISAIRTRYKPNDVVTTIVYNGVQYKQPDFTVTVTCAQGQGPVTSTSCNNTGTNGGKFVYRDEPSSSPSTANNCQIDGKAYIADASSFSNISGTMQPAEYRVRVAPTPLNAAAATIQLTARLSGELVGSNGGSGSPEDFGDFQVRWYWRDASGIDHWAPSQTGWQAPDTAVDVNMPLPNGVVVSLFVSQQETEPCQPQTPLNSPTPPAVTVPKRHIGAQTIQITGRSVGGNATSTQHSDFGVLGMKAYTDDYFVSFVGDPSTSVRSPSLVVREPLNVIDANGTVLRYNDVRNFGATVTSPATIIASLDNQGTTPVLKLDATNAAPGEYDIDFQLNTPNAHSIRYHLRVEPASNPSITSWVTALCYANFKLTDMSNPNVVKGRAISGCLTPEQITTGLKGRLMPW